MDITYRNGDRIGGRRVDFLVDEKIMVELKSIAKLRDDNKVQTNKYYKDRRISTICFRNPFFS
jgi:hypothetical protein